MFHTLISTVKSRNDEFRYNDKSHYYRRLFDEAVIESAIEKSLYYAKSHNDKPCRNFEISLYIYPNEFY